MSAPSVRTLVLLFCWSLWSPHSLLAGLHAFHVAPGGHDRNAGTSAHPFRTITRARDAVRALRRAQPRLTDTVTVYLHAGRYYLREPLLFEPEDGGTASSPTLYQATNSSHVTVSGGLAVTGWHEGVFNHQKVWSARLSTASVGAEGVHALWVNGQRQSPARLPHQGYYTVEAVPDVVPATEWLDGQSAFTASPGDLRVGTDVKDAEVVVMNRWVESHLPVKGFDPARRLLTFSRRSVFRLDPGDPYYLLHAPAALDSAHEWLYDSGSGTLHYIPAPGERLESFDAVIGIRRQLVRITGSARDGRYVEHLIFRNIEFSHTRWHFPSGTETDSRNPDAGGFVQAATGVPAAIECTGMRFCRFEHCVVSHTGTYGIALRDGCRGNRVVGCELYDLDAGGVMIGMKTIETDAHLETSDNSLINNHIHDGGRHYHSAIGVWVGQSPGNHIIRNHIHDFLYTGISIGWTWGYGPARAGGNIVEGNHVHHIGVLSSRDGPTLSDLGGIYTLGTQRGSVIRHNIFHDIAARLYGGWGIYFDEGSTGIVAEDNLVYRTTHAGFHQHYGRENIVRNNIFAFGRDAQIQRTRVEHHTSFAFERNIVLWKGGKLFAGNMRDGDIVMERNLYWPETGEFRSDSLTFPEWQALGFDRHSMVADPLFVDAVKGDFHLRAGSPAFALGFTPIEVDTVLRASPEVEETVSGTVAPSPRRFLYNNDGSNILMAYDTLTARLADRRIDPLSGTGITTFLHNVNPGQNMGYHSSVGEMYRWNPPTDSARQGWGLLGRRMSDNLARLTRDSLDPVALVMDRARLRGMESLLSFRMNELHDVDKPESPLLSRFWKSHPEYRVGGYEGWGKEALNYAIPEVRSYIYALLAEVVDRYDLDGLELDFMRFPYYFPFQSDSMKAYAQVMTSFVQRVRHLTDSSGVARRKKILLCARVPTSLKGCAHVGLDPAAWCQRGFIDFLTVAPFLSTETDIPVGEFKAACGAVPVYTGMEFTIGSRQMTRQEKRAAASLLYASGSDGLYLFNYFVAWDAGLEADTVVLGEMSSPDSLEGKDKLYTLAIPRYPVPGVSLPGQLPLAIAPGEGGTLTIRTHETHPPTSLTLRVECAEEIAPRDVQLEFNGTDLGVGRTPVNPQLFPEKIWPSLPVPSHTVEYTAPPQLLKPVNTLRLTSHRSLRVEWVYLAVRH